MRNGSVIRAQRQREPDVWLFRWRFLGIVGIQCLLKPVSCD